MVAQGLTGKAGWRVVVKRTPSGDGYVGYAVPPGQKADGWRFACWAFGQHEAMRKALEWVARLGN